MANAGTRPTTKVGTVGTRYDDLQHMLEERRRELANEVQGRLRDVRAGRAEKPHASIDQGETAEVDIQDDIELALIQMKAETLSKFNEALTRLECGRYGVCFECGQEISEARLRALPFAVRCTHCEAEREHAMRREHLLQKWHGATSVCADRPE